MRRPDAFSCLMMAAVGALWGLHGPVVVRAFAAGFTFPQLAIGEAAVGALVFGAATVVSGARMPADGRFWAALVAAGALGGGVPLFLFWSYRLGPVSIGATLLFLNVPFAQLINLAASRRPPSPREIAAIALILSGAGLATDFFATASAANLRGAPFAIMAAACFAGFFSLTSRLGQAGTPAIRSGVCCATTVVVLCLACRAVGWPLVPAVTPLARAGAWILVLGVIWQVIPVFLIIRFVPRTGSGLGTILASTELPVAVLASAVFLGESIRPLQIAGIALVLAGVALPQFPRLDPAAG